MKNKLLFLIGGFVTAIFLGIGLTYAYFSARITGNESASTITLEAGELSITMDGTNTINTPEKLIPDSTTPFSTKVVTLTGKNTAINLNMPYTLSIVVDQNTFTPGSIKYSITGVNNSNSGVIIPNMEMQTIDTTTSVGSGFFEKGNPLTHTYTLNFYFPDTGQDQSINMGAKFRAHIEITGVEAEEPAPKGWWKADSETLLGAIRDNSIVHQDTDEGMTVPGVDTAEEDEGLRMTLDDYGVSYYFRGAVNNNYVTFAGMCWKIIRVDGNGNTKLILWNKDGIDCTTSSAQGQAFNNGKYTKEGSDTEYEVYNTASGVGFMYGEPDSKQTNVYAEGGAQENKYDSSILGYLKTWYENTFNVKDNTLTSNYTEALADVIWCGDKSFYQGPGYAESGDADKIDTYFNAYKRLAQNPKSPSLVCPSTSIVAGETVNIGNISKYTAADTTNGNGLLKKQMGTDENNNPIYKYYKVGLITIDEAAFAGGAYGKANSTYYLYTGLNTHFWTMSPSYFLGTYARVWVVYSSGNLDYLHVGRGDGARPAVSLKSDIQATYDKTDLKNKPAGSAGNPYNVSVS